MCSSAWEYAVCRTCTRTRCWQPDARRAGQEDDIIGLLASEDIAQLKPLGDRILIAVRARACC